jgi:hypothetical protein
LQKALQHCASRTQPPPAAVQAQRPPLSHTSSQHSAFAEQLAPAGLQSHRLPRHVPPQQKVSGSCMRQASV